MKLHTLALAAALTTVSLSTIAAPKYKFTSSADNLETKVCMTAAAKGMSAAKALVNKSGLSFHSLNESVTCNGKSIKQFANTYYNKPGSPEKATVVSLVAQNNNVESKVCIDALSIGVSKAKAMHNVSHGSVMCNGKTIGKFVKDFKKRNAVIAGAPK